MARLGVSLGPVDLFQQSGETLPALRVEVSSPSDSPEQVISEVGVVLVVLAVGPISSGVGKSRFEQVELPPVEVGVVVDNDAGEALSLARTADTGFAGVDAKSFFGGDAGDQLDDLAHLVGAMMGRRSGSR
jgi:hypothetical protein